MNYDRLIRIRDKVKICVLCLCAGRNVAVARPRKTLIKLKNSSIRPRNLKQGKRRERVPRGLYSYKLYEIHICNHIAC